MAEDIADRLDDLICAWDKVVGTDLYTLVLLLLGKNTELIRQPDNKCVGCMEFNQI